MDIDGGRGHPGAGGRADDDGVEGGPLGDSIDEDPIVELAELRETASEQLAGRVHRAVDRVETAAHLGDFSGGVLKRVLFEMVSLLIGLFSTPDEPRDEGSD